MPPRGPRGLQAEHWYEHFWQDLREEHLANSLPLGLFRLLSDSLSWQTTRLTFWHFSVGTLSQAVIGTLKKVFLGNKVKLCRIFSPLCIFLPVAFHILSWRWEYIPVSEQVYILPLRLPSFLGSHKLFLAPLYTGDPQFAWELLDNLAHRLLLRQVHRTP